MSTRHALDVRLDGYPDPIGRLDALDNGSIEFRYAEPFLHEGRSISLSLPFDGQPVGDLLARAFFDNLLPENDQMQRVIDREGLERNDVVGVLAHVGADCAGAISCLPVGAPPIKIPGDLAQDYRPLAHEELALIVRRLAEQHQLPDGIEDPSPVAGVQRKVALTLLPDGRFALPADGRKVPTTHILKVPRQAEAAEAKQEDAACRLAAACGFAASNSEHIVIDDVDALLIERFDRIVQDGIVYRVHQEDFAQALGLPANLKYERNGREDRRFDAEAARSVLERLSQPAPAIETFLLSTLFNLAIGNNDNHAKNYGVLYEPDGRPVLAPLYDLLPIQLHDRYTDRLAFNIGAAERFADMTAGDIYAFLKVFGLEGARAKRLIEGPALEMLETIEERSALLPKAGLKTFDDLVGREIDRLSEILELELHLRERDYIGPRGGGWVGES